MVFSILVVVVLLLVLLVNTVLRVPMCFCLLCFAYRFVMCGCRISVCLCFCMFDVIRIDSFHSTERLVTEERSYFSLICFCFTFIELRNNFKMDLRLNATIYTTFSSSVITFFFVCLCSSVCLFVLYMFRSLFTLLSQYLFTYQWVCGGV